MGFFFENDSTNKIMRLSFEGRVTDAGLWASYSIAVKYFASRPACRGIISFVDVSSFEVHPEMVKSLTRSAPALPVEFPIIVVAPQQNIYGMARLFSILGKDKGPNLTVVRSMPEAYELFRLKSPEFRRVSLET
jgi:hypothetical protein